MLTRHYSGVRTRWHYCNMVESATARILQDGTCVDCLILLEVCFHLFLSFTQSGLVFSFTLAVSTTGIFRTSSVELPYTKTGVLFIDKGKLFHVQQCPHHSFVFSEGKGVGIPTRDSPQQYCHCPPRAAPSRERTQTSLSWWKHSKTTLWAVLPLPGGCGSGYRTEETGSTHKPWGRWKRSVGHAPNKSMDCNQEQRLSQAVALALG